MVLKPDIRINEERLKSLLDGINGFGQNPATGGYDRIGFSDADMAVRKWFADRMRSEGLVVRMDGAANVWGRLGPCDGAAVVAGSHLDTVPSGGAYDGALGVAAALEAVLSLRDSGFVPRRAIEVLATSEEEGRFGGMLGSQAIAGLLNEEWLENARDSEGVLLADAMRLLELEPRKALGARRTKDDIAAFIELHIEQGPVLEAGGLDIGIVHTISGMASLSGQLIGRANHSGTTPMDMRADAFAGLADFAATLPALISSLGTEATRITIGHVELEPNFPHTIPGSAGFTIILRDADAASMQRLASALETSLCESAARHRLKHRLDAITWLDPVRLDAGLADIVQAAAVRLSLSYRLMESGAGHDAQTMQTLCPSALIFVPSVDGISHAPEEQTEWQAIIKGANLLAAALFELSGAPT
ncbi:Zn-dependent hydrolase [Fulvimarina sp. MAC3]|uniref:Zn-dependent hydrolase n=1 Tax=Fulvimarina sp. MAC3 TaxID=3148887 RepID=UPI0031FDECDD